MTEDDSMGRVAAANATEIAAAASVKLPQTDGSDLSSRPRGPHSP
jgi:hypothetical protein